MSIICEGSCPAYSTTNLSSTPAESTADCRCQKGYFFHENQCHQCLRGFYFNASAKSKCLPCPAGMYKSTVGQDIVDVNNALYTCQACPEGTYSLQTGATSIASCVSCPINSHTRHVSSATSLLDCRCEDGYVMLTDDKATQCNLCDVGYKMTVNTVTGTSFCEVCGPGTFQEQKGQRSCTSCPADTFLETSRNPSQASCQNCGSYLEFSTTNGVTGVKNRTGCVCMQNYYYDGTKCRACPLGASCLSAGLEIDTVTTLPGYWRATSLTDAFYLCIDEMACVGGQILKGNTTDVQCTNGTSGPLCARCAKGYARVNTLCIECPGGKASSSGLRSLAIAGGSLFYSLLLFYFTRTPKKKKKIKAGVNMAGNTIAAKSAAKKMSMFLKRKQTGMSLMTATTAADVVKDELETFAEDNIENQVNKSSGSSGGGGRKKQKGGSTEAANGIVSSSIFVQMYSHMKVLIGFFQITSAMTMTFDVPWPASFVNLCNMIKAINIDYQAIFAPLDPCSFKADFVQAYYYHMATLPAVCFVIFLAAVTAKMAHKTFGKGPPPHTVTERASKTSLFIVFLLYPGLGTRIFTMFKCDTVAGTSWLEVDYETVCFEGSHAMAVLTAIVFIGTYVVGIPLVSVGVLYRWRKQLWDPRFPELTRMYGSLFVYYKPEFWWFEFVESLKKMMLAGGMVVVANGSSAQVIIAIVISLMYLVIILDNHPYIDPKDQKLQSYSTVQIILTLIMGLTLKLDTEQTQREQDAIGILLICINGSVVLMTVAAAVASLPSCSTKVQAYRDWAAENDILEDNVKELAGLPPSAIQTIIKRMTLKSYKPKDVILSHGTDVEPKFYVICTGHVIKHVGGKYNVNLGPGRVIGEDLFNIAHGAVRNTPESYEALTKVDTLEMTTMQRDQLLASGVIHDIDMESTSRNDHTMSAKVVPIQDCNAMEKLREIRQKYGANSNEYAEALKRSSNKE